MPVPQFPQPTIWVWPARHSTHVLVVVSHTGVVPPHCELIVHAMHTPSMQDGVVPAQAAPLLTTTLPFALESQIVGCVPLQLFAPNVHTGPESRPASCGAASC
jgi:hypothetical protein